jgi:alpha-1,6-mannosyltransferase
VGRPSLPGSRRASQGAIIAGLGAFAGIALAVLAVRRADTTALSPIRPEGDWRFAYIGGVTAAFGFYLLGVGLLARARGSLASVLALAAAIQLVPLASPLLLSTDAYSYWDYGRIAAVHGGNPYADRPTRWPSDPAYERMGADWRARTSVYGPAFTLATEGDAQAAGSSQRSATLLFRLLSTAGVLGLLGATAAASRGSPFAVAFVGWNPLLALHFAGGGHNDSLMAALVICALALRRAGRTVGEGSAWVVAAAVKPIALVFLPLRALEALRRKELRALAAGVALATAVGAAFSSLRYGAAWLGVLSPLTNQLRQTSSLGLPYWLDRTGVPERVARDVLVLLFGVLYLWLLRDSWRRARPRYARCAVGLLLATSWLQPWYAVWAVPLAAIEEDAVARLGALALTAYLLRDALPL